MTELIPPLYTISRLNREVRARLEGEWPAIWVTGEVSGLILARSGHRYFSLKDSGAQVRCSLFRHKAFGLPAALADGVTVEVLARPTLYEPRGDFQLTIESLQLAGEGELLRQFIELKQRLEREGLFAVEHKQPLPTLPRAVGVVTSPQGAAIRDVMAVLKRRYPALEIIIYPTLVQGAEAPAQIVRAIELANQRRECDLLLITRGGGSAEDLSCFNHEAVVRAIFHSALPTLSAIGHEIDFTLADYVADQRAPTPSAAAELISPDGEQLQVVLRQSLQRLTHAIEQQLRHERLRWQSLEQRRSRPLDRIERLMQQIDGLEQRLQRGWSRQQQQWRSRLQQAAAELNAVSPLATLQRGYSITTAADGTLLRSSHQLQLGATLTTRFEQGRVVSRVVEIDP